MTKQDPRPRLLRRVIIDMLPYSVTDVELQRMQDRLGLVPSSLDTLEFERKESNARIASISPISDAIVTMSGYSAEAIAEFFLMKFDSVVDPGDEDDEDDEEIPMEYLREVLIKQNKQVIVTAVHTVVSHLVASGILEFGEDFK